MSKTKDKLFPKNIYVYNKLSNNKGLCVYVCDTDNDNKIIVGIIDDEKLEQTYVKLNIGLRKVLYLDSYLMLDVSQIERPFYYSGKLATITSYEYKLLTDSIYRKITNELSDKIHSISDENFVNNQLKDITLPEKIIKLLTWNIKKSDLKFLVNTFNVKVMEHCIYFAYLGTNIGSEIEKLRPVLIWKKHINKNNESDNSYYVFPITSKPQRKYYYTNIKIYLNGCVNYIKLNQGKVISIKRIYKPYIEKIGTKVARVDEHTIQKIKNSLAIYFGIK